MDNNDDFDLEELEAQHAAELPERQLLTGLALGLPYLGIGGFDVYVEAGPVAVGTSIWV